MHVHVRDNDRHRWRHDLAEDVGGCWPDDTEYCDNLSSRYEASVV